MSRLCPKPFVYLSCLNRQYIKPNCLDDHETAIHRSPRARGLIGVGLDRGGDGWFSDGVGCRVGRRCVLRRVSGSERRRHCATNAAGAVADAGGYPRVVCSIHHRLFTESVDHSVSITDDHTNCVTNFVAVCVVVAVPSNNEFADSIVNAIGNT